MSYIPIKDISLRGYELTSNVRKQREYYFHAIPEICTERPRLITAYCRKNGLFGRDKISVLDRARQYRYVLENFNAVVRFQYGYGRNMEKFIIEDTSPFAGSTTTKFKGVPLYPEFMALTIWPELHTIKTREKNPYFISDKDVDILNKKVFPFWINDTITERCRSFYYQVNHNTAKENAAPELKLLEQLVFFLASKPNCISHTIPDFSRAIYSGLENCINDAETLMKKTDNQEQKMFYTSIIEVFTGIITFSARCAEKARLLAKVEKNKIKKMDLLEIAQRYDNVPRKPARTFQEGLTTVWLCWIAIHLENPNVGMSLGRLDQVLWPLYKKGIESGELTVEDALESICYLWLKIGDHVPMVPETGEQLFGGSGSNQAITIGGITKEGNDAVNDLTYVIIRATELLKLRDPNLNARYHSGINSPDYLKRLCQCNINTGATPALHNDREVIHALTSSDHTLEQARDYGIIGCVEPGSNGRMYGHSAALLINLASILELTLYNGCHRHFGAQNLISVRSGSPFSFGCFEEFKNAFKIQAAWLIENCIRLNEVLGKIHQEFYPTPVLSSFFEGPLEKGKDLIEGGALINSSGVTIIGLADVADSLSAIEMLIYIEKRVSYEKLIEALDTNFKNDPALHTRLCNSEKTPKFGNENYVAEQNVRWILEMLNDLLKDRKNYRGGKYKLGVWTMTNHAGFGRLMNAMPNGRKAGENFASGFTPVSGVTKYLTKVLNSVASQPSELTPNGFALNLKYTPEGNGMLDNFMASIEGYFENGGMEIQFNIINRETLLDAVKNPDKYPELLVRVSGYTAYFKDLCPQMQKEIIDRTEYLLSSQEAVGNELLKLNY